MATHSSTLAWRIPRTEESDRLQFVGLLRVGHDWATITHATCQLWLAHSFVASLLHQGTHIDRVLSDWTLLDKGKENLINQPGF